MLRRLEVVFAQRYANLVQAAYLVQTNERDRYARLVRAHRVTQSALPLIPIGDSREHADDAYRTLLARVIRFSMRKPRLWRRGTRSFISWTRPRLDLGTERHNTIERALSSASGSTRAAFAVLAIEHPELRAPDAARDAESGTTPAAGSEEREAAEKQIRRILYQSGVADTRGALARAYQLRETLAAENSISLSEQNELLEQPPLNPHQVELGVPDVSLRRGARLIQVTALAAVVAAAVAIVGAADSPDQHSTKSPRAVAPTTRVVAASAWQSGDDHSLALWPTRGGLAQDTALRARAAKAWAAASSAQNRPDAQAQLLFAGKVDEQTVVVLADRLHIVRYAEGGGQPRLSTSLIPASDDSARSAVILSDSPTGVRYLLAPWVAHAQIGDLQERWRPLPVSGGVSSPVTNAAGAGKDSCWDGPILRLDASDVRQGKAFALAGLTDGPAMTHLTYQPQSSPAGAARKSELDNAGAAADWSQLGCALHNLSSDAPQSVSAWRFASSPLPESNAPASWVCLRSDSADGRSHTAAYLLTGTGSATQRLGETRRSTYCNEEDPALAAATWWKTSAGHWYYLVAASSHVTSLSAPKESDAHSSQQLLTVGPRKEKGAPPTVKAVDGNGAPVRPLA